VQHQAQRKTADAGAYDYDIQSFFRALHFLISLP
jgi:hypothetical protein